MDTMTPAERQTAIASILTSPPDILLFKHWHVLTDRDIPRRKDLETNDQYLKAHWQKLRRYAKLYKEPNA